MTVEKRICIQRAARYFVAGDLEGPLDEVWFVLHGYGQLAAEFLEGFAHLHRPGRRFVAPEGISRFYRAGTRGEVGASWMTRIGREDEIADYVAYLDGVYAEVLGSGSANGVRVVALGFSQGSATVLRWAALGKARVERLVSWAGDVPPDLDLEPLVGKQLTRVAGTRDGFLDDERLEREGARLDAAGVAHELLRFEGGHRLDRETLAGLAG